MRTGNLSATLQRDLRSRDRSAIRRQRHSGRTYQSHREAGRRDLAAPNRTGLVNNYIENNVQTNDLNAFDLRGDMNFGRRARSSRATPAPIATSSSHRRATSSWKVAMPRSRATTTPSRATPTPCRVMLNELRVGVNEFDLAQVGSDFGIPRTTSWAFRTATSRGIPTPSASPTSTFPDTGEPGRGLHQLGPDREDGAGLGHAVMAGRPPFGQIRRRLPPHHLDADQPADAAARPIHVRLADTSNNGAAGTGDAFASFLLGYPNQIDRDFVDTYPEVLIHFVGFFAQDDFRVTRNLTVNLGLRWTC